MVDVAVGGGHRGAVALPMAPAVIGRDDEVERLANGLGRPMSEQRLGGRVPDADDAGRLGEDKCGGSLCHVTPPAEDYSVDRDSLRQQRGNNQSIPWAFSFNAFCQPPMQEISDDAPYFCLHAWCGRSRAVRRVLS